MLRATLQSRARFQRVLVARDRQLAFRIGLAAALAAALTIFIGLVTAVAWTLAYAALQGVERRWLRRLPADQALGVGAVFLFLNSVAFGAISWLGAAGGGPFALGGAAFCLAGCILNAVVNTQGSRIAFWCATPPYVIYALGLPVIALMQGAAPLETIPLWISAVMVPALAAMTAKAMDQALNAEEQALIIAESRRRAAESATAAKSNFVAAVSHELRTPITAILAGAQALSQSQTGQGRAQADLIGEAGAMMRTLLNDLLDLSKVEAGKLTLEILDVDLRRLVLQTHRFWADAARAKSIRLRLEGAHRLPAWVRTDPTRLRQILNNLLSNAIKFTDRGSVTLSLSVRDVGDGAWLSFSIRDTGPGMTTEQMSRLFQPFQQAGAEVARLHGGSGLGLAISRDLARLMGGDVLVASAPGIGSAFTAEIRLDRCQPPSAGDTSPRDDSNPPQALSVLVVDDHAVNQQAFRLILESVGASVTTAADGGEALNLLALEVFDLVLLDLNMPGLSGLDVVRRLRAGTGPNAAIPVFAVTGSGDAETASACLAAGMTRVLVKPIGPADLIGAIAALDDTADNLAA